MFTPIKSVLFSLLFLSLVFSDSSVWADQELAKKSGPLLAPAKRGLKQFSFSAFSGDIIHDSEFQLLQKQHGEKWAAEDKEIEKKLDSLKKKHSAQGTPLLEVLK